MKTSQYELFNEEINTKRIPSTQYLGSKAKLITWIIEHLPPCNSILDAFSGSGVVSYAFKKLGKQIICNDFLRSSYYFVKAFVENNTVTLSEEEIKSLLKDNPKKESYIEDNFTNVFYTQQECQFLDNLHANILELEDEYKQSLAFAGAVRCCIQKVPGGKFRPNILKYRDKNFKHYRPKFTKDIRETFLEFLEGYNQAVFDNNQDNIAYNENIFDLIGKIKVDATYFDPPYGGSGYDYERDYFFVELFTQYYGKKARFTGKTKSYSDFKECGFNKKTTVSNSIKRLFESAAHIPIWVISYNNRSIPHFEEFKAMLEQYKKKIRFYEQTYSYKFGDNNRLREYLFVCS
ncbi:MAG: DNA adenine methylase [bacterium]|nr:DNA adenine methylase [bacterium]